MTTWIYIYKWIHSSSKMNLKQHVIRGDVKIQVDANAADLNYQILIHIVSIALSIHI